MNNEQESLVTQYNIEHFVESPHDDSRISLAAQKEFQSLVGEAFAQPLRDEFKKRYIGIMRDYLRIKL